MRRFLIYDSIIYQVQYIHRILVPFEKDCTRHFKHKAISVKMFYQNLKNEDTCTNVTKKSCVKARGIPPPPSKCLMFCSVSHGRAYPSSPAGGTPFSPARRYPIQSCRGVTPIQSCLEVLPSSPNGGTLCDGSSPIGDLAGVLPFLSGTWPGYPPRVWTDKQTENSAFSQSLGCVGNVSLYQPDQRMLLSIQQGGCPARAGSNMETMCTFSHTSMLNPTSCGLTRGPTVCFKGQTWLQCTTTARRISSTIKWVHSSFSR